MPYNGFSITKFILLMNSDLNTRQTIKYSYNSITYSPHGKKVVRLFFAVLMIS